eukprot:EG_transcript_7441
MPTLRARLLRSSKPAPVQVRCGAESLASMGAVAAAVASATSTMTDEPLSSIYGDVLTHSASTSLLRPADIHRRHPSDSGSSFASDSSTSYAHNPYSFEGPTFVPSPRSLPQTPNATFSAGRTLVSTFCLNPLPGPYGTDLTHGPSPQHCQQRESRAVLHAPDTLSCPPPTAGLQSPPPQDASSSSSSTSSFQSPLQETGGSPCPPFTHPPAGPNCLHPRPWRRLRAKRGLTTYICRDCGIKWRTLSPCLAAALENGAV